MGYPHDLTPAGYIPIGETVEISDIDDRLDFLEADAAVTRAALYDAAGYATRVAQALEALIASGRLPVDFISIPGTDQTSLLLAALNKATPPIFPPGSVAEVSAASVPLATAILDLGARTNWQADLNGLKIVQRWDPTNDTTIDETLAAKPLMRLLDWKQSSMTGFSVDYSPRVYSFGLIESLITPLGLTYATALVVRPYPGLEPAFQSADKLEIVDPATGIREDWTHYKGAPGSLLPNGDGTWTFTPVPRTISVNQVVSLNPLTVRAPSNLLLEGQLTTAQGFAPGVLEIGGVSVVNGKVFSVKPGRTDDDSDGDSGDDGGDEYISNYIRFYDPVTGMPIDATGASGGTPPYTVTSGTVTGVGVPTAATVGRELRIFVRKRANNVAWLNRCDGLRFNPRIKSAVAVSIAANACRNVDMGDWSLENASAGGILARDCSGYFNASGWSVRGAGDCAWAVRATDWTPQITAFDQAAGTITLGGGFGDGSVKSTKPLKPVKGLPVIFHNAGVRTATLYIASATDTVATFTTPLPVGYNPATWTLTPGYVASQDIGDCILDGIAASGIEIDSDDFRGGRVGLSCIRGDGIRFSESSTSKPGGSGAGEGFSIDTLVARNCGGKLNNKRGSIITMRRLDNNGNTATNPQNSRASKIGRLDVDGARYGVIAASGFALEIAEAAFRNTGTKRGTATANNPLANNDIFVEQASVTIGKLIGPAPSVYLGTNGTYVNTLTGASASVSGAGTFGSLSSTTATAGTQTVTTQVVSASADLTISSDSIAPSGSYHRIAAEGGATTDDLITINATGLPVGFLLTLSLVTVAQAITLRQTGNIVIDSGSTYILSGPRSVTLRWSGTAWQVQTRTVRANTVAEYTAAVSTNITVNSMPEEVVVTGPLTATLNLGLLTSGGPTVGDKFIITNLSTGGFNVVVKSGSNGAGTVLATLGALKFAVLRFDGIAWQLLRSGTSGGATP